MNKEINNEMKVSYLGVTLKYHAYLKLQITIIAALIIGALLCFFLTGDSEIWLVKNGWWLLPIVALLEVGESLIAIRKANRDFNKQANSS